MPAMLPEMPFVAALPMYDSPERRDEVNTEWAAIRDRMRGLGIRAPEALTRCNAELPAVPGGIRGANGDLYPDPASLLSGELDLSTLWRHPALLFGQTCWGPMEAGLDADVAVIGQPDYSGIEGCAGPLYSSAIVMRRTDAPEGEAMRAPEDGRPAIVIDCLRGARFAYNDPLSRSGYLALLQDLGDLHTDAQLFSGLTKTGSHRASIRAIANGEADIATIDAKSWQLARRYEPAAQKLVPIGWTARRMGLPFICARNLAPILVQFRRSL